MSIFCAIEWAGGQCRGHAHSFRGTCSFFAAKSGHMGDMSRLRRVGRACPVQPGTAWASRRTCSVFRCVPGQPKRTCSRLQELETGPGGHAYSFRDMPPFPRDMSIFCATGWAGGQSGGHVHSFRGACSFFAARSGHMANMSRLRSVGRACPVQPGTAWASRGTCPFFLERSGPAGGHAHSFPSAEKPPGRTCPLLTARPGHMGYMSGPWC